MAKKKREMKLYNITVRPARNGFSVNAAYVGDDGAYESTDSTYVYDNADDVASKVEELLVAGVPLDD